MDHPKTCRDCPIFKKSLFRDFDDGLINRLADKKVNYQFRQNEHLFDQGNEVTGIYCHLSGLTKVAQTDAAKKIRFSRLVLPGDTSGHRSLFIEQKYKGTAYVISRRLQACFISKSEILYLLANDASFAKNLVIKIATELHRSEENNISIKEKTVRNRLAHLIYRLCNEYSYERDNKQFLIKSEITKREIASLLMVANETIIRLMSEMKSDGLISYENKNILVLQYEKIKTLSKL